MSEIPKNVGQFSFDPDAAKAEERERYERVETASMRSRREASKSFPLDTSGWSDVEWEGYARMAWPRKIAGIELTELDLQAIERFPERPSSGFSL